MHGYIKTGNSQPAWLFPFVVIIVLILSVLPLARLAMVGIAAFADGGVMTVLGDASLWSSTYYTVVTAILGTIISLTIGCLFAFLLTLTDIRAKGALSFFFVLPMMIPPQVTALAWVQMSGPSSPLLKALHIAPPMGSPQPLYSVGGIALLYGVQHAPLVYLALRAGLMTLPRDGVEAARLSGATGLRVFRDIILPLSLPGIIAGAAISFVSCTGNFGIPAILGIPASIFTLPTLIFTKFSAFTNRTFGDVAVLSAIIAIISIVGLMIQDRALRGRDYRVIGLSGASAAFELGAWRFVFTPLVWTILFFMLAAPFFALIAGALVPAYGVPLTFKTMSLHAFQEILFRQAVTRTAFINSLSLAAATALCLLVVTVLAAYALTRRRDLASRIVSSLIEIPYSLPGIVMAVSFILVFAAPIPILHVSLYGTIWIILIAYFSSFFAVSLKPVVSAFHQLDPALEEAARLSGAGFFRRLADIIVPLIAPAAGASVILVFLIACNELTISALLWSAGTQTLGVAIYNLDDSGSSDLASALSVLVVLMVVVLMLLLELLAKRLPKGVVPWRG
ncbi:iron ABC transporter permease [Rhizobium ruizarguesonis]|jgi:iron(III) transport system permease protein|uniref:Iron ABC transporter permease n=1 Tax=Rhizobium ruizarguesonis TaxID=2081791 RepID=A0AB38I2H0_9HYPH|nr:iron ABC transporter permease [Rhizobium ruizarguesonis]QIJ41290.1 iron ABC transporter permease [Rhizobium leguminosarum]NEH26610.1 ABC transporter permease subunit [Rhizobium ruizarguesonis]NEI04892.1 ABC transporter permease subunit [Rhizobium ruizarguesonis]NEI28905.1 ABC transporter permease subunit [Rhizobium ruizarguesonis]NEJ04900.1 ABC transporter permease subunit [Rhizobium ruizarguesonis]